MKEVIMNIKEIKEMISLMNENNLSELEIEKQGLKIKLKKEVQGGVEKVVERIMPKALMQTPASQVPGEQAAIPKIPKTVEIKSPMVGTFYTAPSPDAPPFVKVGDNIEVGQVICIVEAMKLMNEIKSDIKGKVAATLVENADPVEFGQTLFLVEPM
jgi:acetyl-CoA carboxylase biotin carboxyl carrier protein